MLTTTETPPPVGTPTRAGGSRLSRVRASMSRREWFNLGGMAAFILALHVIGWFTLVLIVAPAALQRRARSASASASA